MAEVASAELLYKHLEGLTVEQNLKLEPHVYSHSRKPARMVKKLEKAGVIEMRYDWSNLQPTHRYAQRSDNPEDIQAEYGICLAEKTRAYIIGRMVLASLIWRVYMPLLELLLCSQVQIIQEAKAEGCASYVSS